jgi:prephenate dehydrogenase
MSVQITLVGLGQIGGSIGLALAEHKDRFVRVGIDREPTVSRRAEKMGAVDKIAYNLAQSVRGSDIVVLAVPVDEIHEALQMIAPELKAGCVVIDTSPVKKAVEELARQILPEDRYFVGLTPSLNPVYLNDAKTGLDAAHADLFQNSLMILTSPQGAHQQAVQLAIDLSTVLGGRPFFSDPAETDGIAAASYTLPPLVAAALVNATVEQPGWRESGKVAGAAYSTATAAILALEDKKSMGEAALLNRENVLRVLDNLVEELETLRAAIDEKDAEMLHAYLAKARQAREAWMEQRYSGDWEKHNRPNAPKPPSFMERFLGTTLGNKRPKSGEK